MERMDTMIRVNIYKHAGSDCSNFGLSSACDEAMLLGADEPVPAGFPDTPLIRVVRRTIAGSNYVHAEPVHSPEPHAVHWMHGGCYVKTSDSRYEEHTGVPYPISLHDRYEA